MHDVMATVMRYRWVDVAADVIAALVRRLCASTTAADVIATVMRGMWVIVTADVTRMARF